jgi:hypothetical protein
MKKAISYKSWLLLLPVIFFITSCCRVTSLQEEGLNEYQYVDIKIHDIGKNFNISDVKAILIIDWYTIEKSDTIQVLGNLSEVESIIGREIRSKVVDYFDDPLWLNRITKDFFEEAKRTPRGYFRGYLDDSRVVFITKDKGYRLKIAVEDKVVKVVHGPDYESELIRGDLEGIGFIKPEPLTQPKGVFGPSLEIGFPRCENIAINDIGKKFKASEIKAIFFMDWFKIEDAKTIIVLGDINEVESVIGIKIKAKKIVNDPILINHIVQSFLKAESAEKDYSSRGYLDVCRVVFITEGKCYRLEISVDNKNKIVQSRGYKSEQLWRDLEAVGFTGIEEANLPE